jgi:hypothetical protein
MLDSVTVSIAALTIGMFNEIEFVNLDLVVTFLGIT